jgi:hypothetical protein
VSESFSFVDGLGFFMFMAAAISCILAVARYPVFEAETELHKKHSNENDVFLDRNKKAQHQVDTIGTKDQTFETWLGSERDNAAVTAKAEYRGIRTSGQAVDKMRFKKVLADKCYVCGGFSCTIPCSSFIANSFAMIVNALLLDLSFVSVAQSIRGGDRLRGRTETLLCRT